MMYSFPIFAPQIKQNLSSKADQHPGDKHNQACWMPIIHHDKCMRMLPSKILITLSLILAAGIMPVMAQQGVVSAAGDAAGNDGAVSFSVGQVFYHTINGVEGAISEGLQQPYEISVVTSIGEAEDMKLLLSAYPNPVSDMLTLDVKDGEKEDLQYQLLDFTGKLLREADILDAQTAISMRELDPAVYFLRIIKGNKTIQTFRILKSQ